MDNKKRPAAVLRDGDVKATFWANKNADNKVFVKTTFAKTYSTENGPKDADSFDGDELLRLSEVARAAYRIRKKVRQGVIEAQDPKASNNSPLIIPETKQFNL